MPDPSAGQGHGNELVKLYDGNVYISNKEFPYFP